jgi:hypothetical protein
MQNQPIPDVSRADVLRIIARDFPLAQQVEVLRELDALGESAKPRVQLAVLKLVNGRIAEFEKHLAYARRDWRDVLMWAEYPADAKIGWSSPADAHHPAYQSDWEQYQAWLTR